MTDADATEAALCQAIAGVLGLDRVGPDDGFFEVGGDSVLALQVVARARENGLDLTVRDLFDHQTPASLAAVVGTLPAPRTDDSAGASLVTFSDDEFGEFEVVGDGQAATGAEAEWETIT